METHQSWTSTLVIINIVLRTTPFSRINPGFRRQSSVGYIAWIKCRQHDLNNIQIDKNDIKTHHAIHYTHFQKQFAFATHIRVSRTIRRPHRSPNDIVQNHTILDRIKHYSYLDHSCTLCAITILTHHINVLLYIPLATKIFPTKYTDHQAAAKNTDSDQTLVLGKQVIQYNRSSFYRDIG